MVRVEGDSQSMARDVLKPEDSLMALRGIGERLARTLREEAGLQTIRDLVTCFPRRLRQVVEIENPSDEVLDELVRMTVRVGQTRSVWLRGRRSMVTVTVASPDGTPIELRFFNQPYLKNAYKQGTERVVEGTLSRRGKTIGLSPGRFLPVNQRRTGPCSLTYRDIPGVSENRFAGFVQQALDRVDLTSWKHIRFPSTLHAELPRFEDALRAMHRPVTVAEFERARQRFAAEEAVALFRRVEKAQRARLRRSGPVLRLGRVVEDRIRGRIPFTLTGDQERAIEDLWKLLRGPAPMGVLLQGDVGTGKTAVAICAALAVLAEGYQVAFLAPTELLAEQHFAVCRHWLAGSRVASGLLTASQSPQAREVLGSELRTGGPQLVFGTHALMSAGITFAKLGLVIIDEQHRFGVAQRTELVRKGEDPHVLYMTATPIPRTLTLSMFGDLDLAVLRDKPPGHRTVPAFFLPPEKRSWRRIVGMISRRVARGRQVFVVCPKVGEDGSKGGVVRIHKELMKMFPCGLVHGQMKASLRQEVFDGFRRGELQVLVGTTVLEVGIDVSNSTLIVILGADRFGLATLHQLRGRVGRGNRRGLCVMTGKPGPRIRAVCRTTDGFELAEHDLAIRGAGKLMGVQQSGVGDFSALDLVADSQLLVRIRDMVRCEGE